MGQVGRCLATVVCASLLVGGQSACGEQEVDGPHPLERRADPSPGGGSPGVSSPGDGTTSTPSAGSGGSKGLVMTLDDPRIAESSGLAVSQRHPGVVYTHNDRGESGKLYAVDSTGTRAVLDLGVDVVDTEDVATTPDGRIWVADTGDNDLVRSTVQVIVLDEPDILASATLPVTVYEFRFPDGPHDAEGLLVDPRDGRIHLVTKDPEGGRIYEAPPRLSTDSVNDLEPVADAPPAVSGAAWSPDGSVFVLRNQGRAFFHREIGDDHVVVPLPAMPQGESISFTRDGSKVWVGSEGEGSEVRQVPVPRMPGS